MPRSDIGVILIGFLTGVIAINFLIQSDHLILAKTVAVIMLIWTILYPEIKAHRREYR